MINFSQKSCLQLKITNLNLKLEKKKINHIKKSNAILNGEKNARKIRISFKKKKHNIT